MSTVKEKITSYCQKSKLNMKKFSIKAVEEGYLATDGEASLIFSKDGTLLCLPMYKL
ncbi:hypothetical protein [Clostridium sp. SM-530-WT-3G]|uniref:hypothetical protein n=1 Tax=Clostridium sp. SM-530-WT-3G TaxID=2725303 RepID=UPI00145DC64B|nr:hypothetical protein [Clostridium sp. SM-530-WT-3G]NME81636.1 hypothetical protein [Clostridium sp. SM-530-WT-3G]